MVTYYQIACPVFGAWKKHLAQLSSLQCETEVFKTFMIQTVSCDTI